MSSPAFQFYPADYLADMNVELMTLEEQGAYIRLLCYCWREGYILNDIKSLALLCRCPEKKMKKYWETIKKCFTTLDEDEKKLIHPRLEEEREKQKEFSQKQSERVKKRWGRDDKNTTVIPRYPSGNTMSGNTEHGNTLHLQSSSSSSIDQARYMKTTTTTCGGGRFTKDIKFFTIVRPSGKKSEAEWIRACLMQLYKKHDMGWSLDEFLELFPQYQKLYNRWVAFSIRQRMAAVTATILDSGAEKELNFAISAIENNYDSYRKYLNQLPDEISPDDMELEINA